MAGLYTVTNARVRRICRPAPRRGSRQVARIARKPDFLLNLIRECLDLARIEGGELTIYPKASVDLVKDVVEPALVTCDPDLLKIVAVIFVGNSVKYGRDGGTVRVSVPRSQTAPAGFGP